MSTRSEIADALRAVLPDARVIGYAKSIDNMPPGQPVVMVYRDAVSPGVHQGTHSEDIVILVAVAVTDPVNTDDVLDDLLDDVLGVLDTRPFPSLLWQIAEREAIADTWPCYKITTTILTKKE